MNRFLFLILTTASLQFWSDAIAYDLVRDYSGQTFFQGWDFYGSWDNLTLGIFIVLISSKCHANGCLGDVWWLDEADATSQHLAYINSANNAIIKVDNTTNVTMNQKRNTVWHLGSMFKKCSDSEMQVRITTQDAYALGSLWIIDLVSSPDCC
jgi:hypothetical protein